MWWKLFEHDGIKFKVGGGRNDILPSDLQYFTTNYNKPGQRETEIRAIVHDATC